MSAGRKPHEQAKNIGSLQSGSAITADSPDAAGETLLSELRNDFNFMEELEEKLQSASFNNQKDLLLAFDISYEDRCKVLKYTTPCVAFFENLSMKEPELSLSQFIDYIEKNTANPNKSIFKKIDGDIKKGLVSFKLDSKLGELIADHKAWYYILQNIAGNLIPERGTLLNSWENIASQHGYESHDIAMLKKVGSNEYESPLQKFLSLLCTRKSSITVSEFVNKLKEINREDAARLVESWLKKFKDKRQSSVKDSTTGYTVPEEKSTQESVTKENQKCDKAAASETEERINEQDATRASVDESKHKLQLPIDVINFVKISKILLDVVQKCMRKYFLKQWSKKYPNQKWQSNAVSGEMMVQQLSDVIRTNDYDKILEKIKSGNEMQWDIATLAFVLLDSKLKLISDEDIGASGISREVERLKNTENMFYAMDLGFTCPTDEYKEIISNIKSAVEHIFDKTAVREIDDIDNSPMERKIKIKRRQLQDKEESRKGKGDKSHDILKDHPLILEFATEEANFLTITDLLWSVVPRYLREYFKEQWNKQYTNQKWQSNISSGKCLVSKLPDGIKSTTSLKMIKALETGNEQNWSIGTLVFLLLCPDLNLLEACRPENKRKTPLRPSEEIDLFRRVKDEFFSDHRSDMSCKFEEFREVAEKIKDFVQHTLCEEARTEIVDMIEEQRKRNPGRRFFRR